MRRKNWVWQFMIAAIFVASAICLVAACRSDGSCKQEKKCTNVPDAACPQCNCAVIAMYQDNSDGAPPVLCGVCEIAGNCYHPCAPSVVECPSQNRKKLSACPLCHECKKMLVKKMCKKMHVKTDKNDMPDKECMKKIMNCQVKQMLDPDAIAKNRQCKKCREIAKATAQVKKLQHQKVCGKDCRKEGLCICKDNCPCTSCATPDCKCTCPCSEPVVLEEDVLEIGEIIPLPPDTEKIPTSAADRKGNPAEAKGQPQTDTYPIPAPGQKAPPPANVMPMQVNEENSPAVIVD